VSAEAGAVATQRPNPLRAQMQDGKTAERSFSDPSRPAAGEANIVSDSGKDVLSGGSYVSISSLNGLRLHLAGPRLSTLLRLCSGLGVTVERLFDDLPSPEEPRHRRGLRIAPSEPARKAAHQ
jgi:hypothetical protein